MQDSDFLQWIWDRLESVYHNDSDEPHMVRLADLIDRTRDVEEVLLEWQRCEKSHDNWGL